jgi:hypothetical protein
VLFWCYWVLPISSLIANPAKKQGFFRVQEGFLWICHHTPNVVKMQKSQGKSRFSIFRAPEKAWKTCRNLDCWCYFGATKKTLCQIQKNCVGSS